MTKFNSDFFVNFYFCSDFNFCNLPFLLIGELKRFSLEKVIVKIGGGRTVAILRVKEKGRTGLSFADFSALLHDWSLCLTTTALAIRRHKTNVTIRSQKDPSAKLDRN